MHDSVLRWVASRVDASGLADRETLEVGSLNVNGSARTFFRGRYVGVDMREGPGVDVVGNGHDLPFERASFEVVVCTEVLEHDEAFWLTLREIRRVLRPHGSLLLTTRGNGFGEHREPTDVFRFMPDSMPVLANIAGCVVLEARLDPEVPGIFVHGIRHDLP